MHVIISFSASGRNLILLYSSSILSLLSSTCSRVHLRVNQIPRSCSVTARRHVKYLSIRIFILFISFNSSRRFVLYSTNEMQMTMSPPCVWTVYSVAGQLGGTAQRMNLRQDKVAYITIIII